MSGTRYFRARAPLRLSFCGGGTDVSPYPEEHGGMVLSATINQYAHASLRPRRDSRIVLASLDYDMSAKYDHPRGMRFDGQLDLLKAAIRALKVKRGLDLWVHSDAPPGSGLGASSTLMVALLAVLREWLKLDLSPYDLNPLNINPLKDLIEPEAGAEFLGHERNDVELVELPMAMPMS